MRRLGWSIAFLAFAIATIAALTWVGLFH